MFNEIVNFQGLSASTKGPLTVGTRGDDRLILEQPGIAISGPGDDLIVTTGGPHVIFTGTGRDIVQTDGGFTRVVAQGDVTVKASGGITRVTLSEGATGNAIVEGGDGGMTPPDIIIWDIDGDGEGLATFGGVLWDLGDIDGNAAEVSLQDALDDVTFTLSNDGSDATVALAQDALLIINNINTHRSLEEMIRTGDLVLQIEVEAGDTIIGSEARDIIVLGETAEDVFVFISGIDDPVAYQPTLSDIHISSVSTGGTSGSAPTADALGLTNVTQQELDQALASQVRTEDGAVVTIDDVTITFFAGEAILVTEDFFVL